MNQLFTPTKVRLVGAHSTGKSTLARWISREWRVRTYMLVPLDVAASAIGPPWILTAAATDH